MIGLREIEATRGVIRDLRIAGAVDRADAVEAVLTAATTAPRTPRIRARLDLLTTRQAARGLGISAQIIDEWVEAGHLSSVRVGERQLLRREDLTRFLDRLGAEQRRRGTAAEPPWLREYHSGDIPDLDVTLIERAQTLHAAMEAGRGLSGAERTELAGIERALADAAATRRGFHGWP